MRQRLAVQITALATGTWTLDSAVSKLMPHCGFSVSAGRERRGRWAEGFVCRETGRWAKEVYASSVVTFRNIRAERSLEDTLS